MNSQNQDLNHPKSVQFDEETGYLLLKLDKKTFGFLDGNLQFKDQTFQAKDELHITILSQGAAEKVHNTINNLPARLRQIRELVQETDWSYRKFQRFYHVQDEQGNESIIQMVEVPELQQFFTDLNQAAGKQLEPPPTHVTLYVHGDQKGISLATQDIFNERVMGEISPKVLQHSSRNRSLKGRPVS